jgi:hypothetical protein
LYGIDGTAVDAQLEVERRRAGGRGTDAAELRARIHVIAALHFRGPEVSVQRIVVGAVVDDDEISEPGKRVRVIDGSRVHGEHRRAFRRADFNTVLDERARRAAGTRIEAGDDSSRNRPVERAAKRGDRYGDRFGRASRGEIRDVILEPLRGGAERRASICTMSASRAATAR